MTHLGLTKNINFQIWTGKVCVETKLNKARSKMTARTRLKIVEGNNPIYVDIIGFGNIAQEMELTCKLGAVVYVECSLSNETYTNKKNQTKTRLRFIVNKIDRLYIPPIPSIEKLDSEITILDDIDPVNYLYGDGKDNE